MSRFCTLPLSVKKWIGIGKGTGARKNRKEPFGTRGGEKGGIGDMQKMWVPLSETGKLRGGTKCGVSLEIIVWILNKCVFSCFLGYLSINVNV